MSRIRDINQPRQRLAYTKKDREWRKSNVDYGGTHSFYTNGEIRSSLKNKMINLDLYNGIVNVQDMMRVVNPAGGDASFLPNNIPHNPIIVPKIDLLVGEELNRPFDYSFIVTDSDSITRKKEDKKAEYRQNITEFLQANYSDEELQQKMVELDKHMKYTWKDMREKMANQIIRYYYQKERFAEKFSKGFKDALIFGEECYLIDIVNGDPRLTVLNPLKVRTVKTGRSNRFEDASMIVIEDYKSPNQLIDEYADELKPKDIDALLDYRNTGSNSDYSDDNNNHLLLFAEHSSIDGTLFNEAVASGNMFGSNYCDEWGNIRELRVRWKSLRKVKKVKYYDEFGKTQFRFESEEYISDKNLGEEETILWVSEGWEGVMLGKDVYLKMRPLPVQYTSVNMPHKNHLGVIGQLYNTNQSKPVSLVDRAKNFQYLYDAVLDRTNKAIAANYGKLLEVDLARVPDGWEIEKWLHFAVVNKIAVVDSFKEGTHGAATGKLAGGLNNGSGKVLDLETGNYIQQHIGLLEFIKMEMSEIMGITKQREGQIHNRETVGGVERSVNQSSHITEFWFSAHESVKLRVLEAFLEMAKHSLKAVGNRQAQYILDDQTSEILNMSADDFCESDYGVSATNTAKYKQLEEMIQQNAQAFLQNGGGFKALMDIAFSNSLMDKRRKIEQAEEDMMASQNQAAEQANQIAQEQMEQLAAQEQALMDFNYYKADQEDATKRYLGELKAAESGTVDVPEKDDGIISPLDNAKLNLDYNKLKNDRFLKLKQMDLDMQKHSDDVKLRKESNSISRIQKRKTT